ncbi:hypothetical protein ACOTHJ_15660 [Achromobacter xylosoxidans]
MTTLEAHRVLVLLYAPDQDEAAPNSALYSYTQFQFVASRLTVFSKGSDMWPFLLILAIIPMIFFWSDSVQELFPSLAQYLPDKDKKTEVVAMQPQATSAAQAGGDPGKWYVSKSEAGYVAWVISEDGLHRLAVGCYPDTPATLQVTHLSGNPLPDGLLLNYQFGTLPLTAGAYSGPELINAAAQLKDTYLQSRATEVIAQFKMAGPESNSVARSLSEACPATGDAQ